MIVPPAAGRHPGRVARVGRLEVLVLAVQGQARRVDELHRPELRRARRGRWDVAVRLPLASISNYFMFFGNGDRAAGLVEHQVAPLRHELAGAIEPKLPARVYACVPSGSLTTKKPAPR